MISRSPLFWLIIYFSIGPIFFSSFDDNLLGDSYEYDLALYLHFFCSVLLVLGYLVFSGFFRQISTIDIKEHQKPAFGYLYTSYHLALCVVGVGAAIISATYGSGVQEFVEGVALGSVTSRETFEMGGADGGVPGYIKIFAYGPLAALLNLSSHIYFSNANYNRDRKVFILLLVSIIAVVIKVFFALDRLTIAAVGLVGFAFALRQFRFAYGVYFILLVLLADLISRLRLSETGVLDFLILYSKLGLVNLQLLFGSDISPAFGFETFFHPLLYIQKFLGFSFVLLDKSYSWLWNPAQYLYGFLYLDFSWFLFVPVFFIGASLGLLEKYSAAGSGGVRSVYFVVIYCVFSFSGVPAFRGLEFWFAFINSFVLYRMSIR